MVRYKVFISLLLSLELFGLHSPALAQMDKNKELVIVIDPGHGGKDSGAVGVNGILEKNVVLKIAKKIVELNETIFKNRFEIYLTRYTDTLISLGDRTKLARTLKADLFISLHCNYSDNPNARGVEVYVSKIKSNNLKESISLAFKFQRTLKESIGFISRGVKFADFQVLRETIATPSMLLEFGFLSNSTEASYFGIKENLILLAYSILYCLHNY